MLKAKVRSQNRMDRIRGVAGLAIAVALVIGTGAPNAQSIDLEKDPGMYCRLSSAEMQERIGELRSDFLAHVRGVSELENGYRYSFEKTTQRMKLLADFIDFESQCCTFMRFDLSVEPGTESISLSLTGADGTKQLLEAMMTSVEFDWRAGASDDNEVTDDSRDDVTSGIVRCFREFVGQ